MSEYNRTSKLLEASQAIAHVGGWELDLVTNELFWTAETYRIHDTTPEEFNPIIDAGVDCYMPRSRQLILEALKAATEKGEGYDLELELKTTKGRVIHVSTTAEVTLHNGKPVKLTGAIQDITDLKTAEKAIRESEESISDILNSLPSSLCVIDDTGKILQVNDAWNEFGVSGGHNREQKRFSDYNYFDICKADFENEDARAVFDGLQELLKGKQYTFEHEYPCHAPDKRQWFVMRANLMKTEKKRVVISHIDITERKLLEIEQQNLIEQSNLAIKAGKLGLWTLDLANGQLDWNDQHLEFYGLTREEFEEGIGDWQKQLHPDDAEYANKELSRAINGESFYGVQFRIFRKDGEVRYLDASAIPMYNEANEVVKVVGMNRDITDQKRNEAALIREKELTKESEERYRLLHENAGLGIGYYSTEGIILSFNSIAAKEMNGVSEDFEGKSIFDVYPKDTAEVYFNRLQDVLKTEETRVFEDFVKLPNGDNWFLSTYCKIADSNLETRGIQVISQNITELKRAEQDLKNSEEKFSNAFENAPNPTAILNIKTGERLAVNKAHYETFGYSKSELLDGNIHLQNLMEDQQEIQVLMAKVLKAGSLHNHPAKMLTKSGELRNMLFNSTKLYPNNDDIHIVSLMDVTAQKQQEAALIQSETHLKKVQGIAKVGSWFWDIKTNKVTWTEELYKMYGFDPAKRAPAYHEQQKIFTKESWDSLSKSVDKTVKEGTPYELELNTVREDGSNGWMWVRGEALKNEKGEIYALWGAAQDISIKKQHFVELEHEKRISEILLDYSSSAIYIFDLEHGRNKYINHQYEVILGYSKEEMNAFSADEFAALFHPDDREEVFRHMALVASGEKDVRLEYRFKKKDGDYVYCQSRDSAFEFTKEGKAKSFIGSFVEITEFKQLETARNEAVKANKLKDEFLSNMSHEIRTPLNAIIGFSRLLNDDLGIDDKEIYLDQIQGNSEQLLSLVNDLLNITKLASGNLELKNRPVNLIKLTKSIFAVHHQYIQARHQNLKLNLNIPEKDYDLFIADEIKLKEILHNLIDNAIKFTKKGTIEIGYTYHDKEVEFYVKDDGIGIPKNEWEAIFTRFSQVPGTADVYGGTGLGLAICKGLVEKMGGKIWVESKINVGSTFRFTIPKILVEQIEEEKESFMIPSNKTIKRILIADDSPSVRLFYKTIMKKLNVDVQLAKNGEQAIDFYQQNSDKIDLVLMDIRMPGIGGIEAMKQIKKINPNIPVIAQTAFAMDTELENFRKLGFDDCMTKPIPEEDLFRLIRGLD